MARTLNLNHDYAYSTHFWYPREILGHLIEPNNISAGAGVAAPAGKRVGLVNRHEINSWCEKSIDWGIGYAFEYKISFALAPRSAGS